jgi:hypothetical protein
MDCNDHYFTIGIKDTVFLNNVEIERKYTHSSAMAQPNFIVTPTQHKYGVSGIIEKWPKLDSATVSVEAVLLQARAEISAGGVESDTNRAIVMLCKRYRAPLPVQEYEFLAYIQLLLETKEVIPINVWEHAFDILVVRCYAVLMYYPEQLQELQDADSRELKYTGLSATGRVTPLSQQTTPQAEPVRTKLTGIYKRTHNARKNMVLSLAYLARDTDQNIEYAGQRRVLMSELRKASANTLALCIPLMWRALKDEEPFRLAVTQCILNNWDKICPSLRTPDIAYFAMGVVNTRTIYDIILNSNPVFRMNKVKGWTFDRLTARKHALRYVPYHEINVRQGERRLTWSEVRQMLEACRDAKISDDQSKVEKIHREFEECVRMLR